MIRDSDALATIITELIDAPEPPRAADGQWSKHSLERAREQQVKVIPRIMARLALKASVDDVAEAYTEPGFRGRRAARHNSSQCDEM